VCFALRQAPCLVLSSGARISRFLPVCARRKQPQHPSCPSRTAGFILGRRQVRPPAPGALRREGCGIHLAPPSPPRHLTPLWPQVVILDFFDTFSSSSRRWRHQFMLSVSVLLPDFRRAGCVAARTGVGVTCRGARRALFCVDGGVYLVKLLSYQAHTGLIHTLGCLGQATRPRQALCVHAVERHAPLTRRHTTLTPGSLADYSTRIFRRVQAPIRQRDCSAHPPRRPP
jgi:hypothetical protein